MEWNLSLLHFTSMDVVFANDNSRAPKRLIDLIPSVYPMVIVFIFLSFSLIVFLFFPLCVPNYVFLFRFLNCFPYFSFFYNIFPYFTLFLPYFFLIFALFFPLLRGGTDVRTDILADFLPLSSCVRLRLTRVRLCYSLHARSVTGGGAKRLRQPLRSYVS